VVKVLCYRSEGRYNRGTAVAQWLRCCATDRKVAIIGGPRQHSG